MNSIRSWALALVVFGGLCQSAMAIPILDQSNEPGSGISGLAVASCCTLAQSVTAGLDGLLTQVDVLIYSSVGAVGDVTLRLLDSGLSEFFSTTIGIGTVPLAGAGLFPFTSVDVSSASKNVSVGEIFSIELSRSEGNFGSPPWIIWRNNSGVYNDGNVTSTGGLINPDIDMGFRTWVDAQSQPIPEPTTLAIMSLGIAGLGFRKKDAQ